ncbi:MAG: hypothetical protein ABI574_14075 [Burkholderiales bacterium]
MIHALPQAGLPAVASLLSTAVLERVTLLLNHVLAAEPEATARLRTHSGRSLRIGWESAGPGLPAWLPKPPPATWRVTPAGLLEVEAADPNAPAATPDLLVTLDPKAWFDWVLDAERGPLPMDVQGDAAFATTLGWLSQHVRWDIEDDLARVIGDVPARMLTRLGSQLAQTLRRWVPRRPGAGSSGL